jgi:hypothetical protein
VLATAGRITRRRKLTLTVKPRRSRRFSLKAGPARRVVPQGATATYKLRVARAAGFRRRVKLRVLRLPRGATATWTPTALTVATSAGQRLGSARLVIEGTSRVRRSAGARRAPVRRYSVVVLTVIAGRQLPPPGDPTTQDVEASQFLIAGDLTTPLHPGGGAPLDLVLTNPSPFEIGVIDLRVRAGARTSSPDCAGEDNYAVTQYSGGYPLVLQPGSTRLSALVPNSSVWPQVSMHNLPTNQDACKGAILPLEYEGLATR